jgi:hypothetical protein
MVPVSPRQSDEKDQCEQRELSKIHISNKDVRWAPRGCLSLPNPEVDVGVVPRVAAVSWGDKFSIKKASNHPGP